MNPGPTVFAQIMAGLDPTELARATRHFPMPRASKTLHTYDHFAAMVFAQLTYRESLRGIETCLSNRPALAYRMGIKGKVTRTDLAYANDHRDWRVFSELAEVLMRRAQRLYPDTVAMPGLEADLFALDATVIELVADTPFALVDTRDGSLHAESESLTVPTKTGFSPFSMLPLARQEECFYKMGMFARTTPIAMM